MSKKDILIIENLADFEKSQRDIFPYKILNQRMSFF